MKYLFFSDNKKVVMVAFALLFLFSCSSESVVPKPRGFMKTNYPKKEYKLTATSCPYTFELPTYIHIQDKPVKGDTCFKDLLIPHFNAAIHLTYKSISSDSVLAQNIDQAHNLAYAHTEKADDIQKTAVIDSKRGVYGIIYDIEGNAASQVQFFLTDSSHHFIRAALIFNHRPNYDSLMPAIQYLREDIDQMIKTFKWADFIEENSK